MRLQKSNESKDVVRQTRVCHVTLEKLKRICGERSEGACEHKIAIKATSNIMIQNRTILLLVLFITAANAWVASPLRTPLLARSSRATPLLSSTDVEKKAEITETKEELPYDYEVPEDAVVHIKPAAMRRLRELRAQQLKDADEFLVLRMGVRSGGCSGMSYVMDFADAATIQDDDQVDAYETDLIKCVVDAKSMLYLYGLELDYSTELIGGGFRFFNPNAEESCGCGSSFGV
jgi:iron-sulfur cluster assembly accessory protein